jgi:hypothetical protein
VPELLEPLHQIPLETVGADAIEVVSAKILVVALVSSASDDLYRDDWCLRQNSKQHTSSLGDCEVWQKNSSGVSRFGLVLRLL